jgi:membrane protein implicated in regulation of membrane protease activity
VAAASFRPPWFGNRGVQILAGGALAYNLVQLVVQLVDAEWGAAFLSFAWSVLFGYVLVESLRFRREQEADRDEQGRPDDGTAATG